jgi:2,4-dichlorophenol 6-monooxygenase
MKLLDSYSAERAPIAKQIVTRANQSIGEFGPIFEALGMAAGVKPEIMQKNLEARCDATPAAEKQREAIREAIAFKKYEFDAHGVEMNQRYRSNAVETDGQIEPAFELDAELHYQPTTWPGARIPHVWLFDHDTGARHSTLDLCGKGRFTIFTGIGGEAWEAAAVKVGPEFGLDIVVRLVGPRRKIEDLTGDWARAREIADSGCILVRPDHHVAWRAEAMTANPAADLRRVLTKILAR